MIQINDDLAIPLEELSFTASRSGGPGGQNVNKLNTRVTLLFDLENSPSLDPGKKTRIRQRLAGRINREGVLRVVCQEHRSQAANRRGAIELFAQLLAAALKRRRPRRKTRVPRSVVERRLKEKKRRGEVKRKRSGPVAGD